MIADIKSQTRDELETRFHKRGQPASEKAVLQNAVTATDQQIDALVHKFYGLTPEEIALVEGAR